jgi:molybdenum cofactor cytidylyltransferase
MFEHFKSWLNAQNNVTKSKNGTFSTAAILLAAGRGSRFDNSGKENKLLAKYKGVPVIEHSALNLANAVPDRIAVIRTGANQLRKHLESAGFKVVECPDAASGMGHSLAWGVAEAMKLFDMQMLVVALADMPSVKTETIRRLLEAARETDDIVAPSYQGKRGNPVVFQAVHFEKLSRLSGDRGASQFMKNEKITLVEVDDPGIHRDIDSSEDLNH